MMATGSRDSSVREAKVFVKEVVRNDWDFEAGVPSPSSADGTLCNNREVCEWRVREFDTPTSELEPQSSDSEAEYGESAGVKSAPGDAGVERRRKRRRQMDDEMAWNEGLRVWMARRDAWCGAKTRRQIRAEEAKRALAGTQTDTADQSDSVGLGENNATSSSSSQSAKSPGQGSDGIGASDLAARTETSLSVADREKSEELQHRVDMTSGQQEDQEEGLSTAPDEGAKRKASSETNITVPDQKFAAIVPTQPTLPAVENQTEEEKEEEELDEPLCPVAPPFISDDNPVRATINPAIYPSIYTKVVVQGMTPTVPVNLAHLTKAMVQGWKSDGQWPPKPAVTSIVLADDASVPKKTTEEPPQGRRKNSITNAVKKVFHFGSHPFHRRASQDTGNGGATGPTN
ncbi:hypothetical protein N7517_001479 [Penicillium concentricum]|uniref:Gag1-like clamp domain-containing protein n=1 Tax=Penicillium concentricum TaxID=293559 RepID=A0A9W9SRV8_9EURO|nr:uncharacterized protein N7517_001479 [Penicillium concentricum]KAJ5383568.1 hypothetical protein N7517_001479 [Penicillium concentricum]